MKTNNGNRNTLTILRHALIAALCLPMTAFAQADVHFSQFYETSLLRNPALAGVFTDNYRVSAAYRSQWSSITNPYQTLQLCAEYRLSLGEFSNDFLSFGLLGYMDKAGDLDQKITGIYPAVNFNKSLSADNYSYLSMGFVAGYLQYSFDPTKATFNNQFQNGVYDPNNPTNEVMPNPQMTIFDIGAGVNFNITPHGGSVTYLVGVSGYHFTQPAFSYTHENALTENVRWNVNGAVSSDLNENVLLQLHANYSNQGSYNELMGGGLLGWQTFDLSTPLFGIYAGAFYRIGDAVIPAFKLRYKNCNIGVSYDVNVSKLKEASKMQGGLELTLSLTGNYPPGFGVLKKTVCPRF